MMNLDIELKEEERTRCEVFSRVMGYHRPVSEWNLGKKQEFKERKLFREPRPTPIVVNISEQYELEQTAA